jgi:hypothetical protein
MDTVQRKIISVTSKMFATFSICKSILNNKAVWQILAHESQFHMFHSTIDKILAVTVNKNVGVCTTFFTA